MQGRRTGKLLTILGLVGWIAGSSVGCQTHGPLSVLRTPSPRTSMAAASQQAGPTAGSDGVVLSKNSVALKKVTPATDHVALAHQAMHAGTTTPVRSVLAETVAVETPLPRELWKESLPPYIIEPPDTLVIEAIRVVPLPPYRLEALDMVLVQVAEALPNQPITGNYVVGPDGALNLGFSYGAVRVAGLTLEQAAAAIKSQLGRVLKAPQVGLALAQFRGMQQVRGEHLVSMDGTINLGSYGAVYVTGLTVVQAKAAVEKHLSRWLLNPEVSLTVSGYNSKVYYVITDGAGYGEQVFRFPITGNETVLDALSNINGIPPAGSKRYIWVARPAPASKGCYQVLPVDWEVITQAGSTETNYQIFPGDRVYVQADKLIRLDNHIAKLLAPIERIFGAALLGNFTIRSFERSRSTSSGTTLFPF